MNGGLVEAMGGCRPPTPAPAGWVRPCTRLSDGDPPEARSSHGSEVQGLWSGDFKVRDLI